VSDTATDNFEVREGASFTRTWFYSGVTSVTGLAAQVDFREKADDTSALYFSLSTTTGELVLSTSTRTIVINGVPTVVPGVQVVLTIAPSVTSTKTFSKAHFDWKLMGQPAGYVRYPIKGVMTLAQRVTP
jgi:hypothetical protein